MFFISPNVFHITASQDAKLASLEAEIARQKEELQQVREGFAGSLRKVQAALVAAAEQRRQEEQRRKQQELELASLLEGIPGVPVQQNGEGPATNPPD